MFPCPLKSRLRKTQAQLGFQGTDHEVFAELRQSVPEPKIRKRAETKSLMVVTALPWGLLKTLFPVRGLFPTSAFMSSMAVAVWRTQGTCKWFLGKFTFRLSFQIPLMEVGFGCYLLPPGAAHLQRGGSKPSPERASHYCHHSHPVWGIRSGHGRSILKLYSPSQSHVVTCAMDLHPEAGSKRRMSSSD